jgi:hypothetical protein
MRTEFYIKLIIFVTIIWLTLSQSVIVRSQPVLTPTLPNPYLPTTTVNTAQPQQTQLQQLPPNIINNNNNNNNNINTNQNRSSSIASFFKRKKQPTSWQQISTRNSFAGRNMRGTEIFGAQIEPSTTSDKNIFTTLETFTYNRNSFISSQFGNSILSFNVNSLVNAQSIPMQSLPVPGTANTSRQYNVGIATPPSYMRDEVVTFLGNVANGTASMSDFDVSASPSLIEYARTYGIDPSRVAFDSGYSYVKFVNPIGGTYAHDNNLQDAQITYDFLAKYKIPYNVSSGGVYGLGRQKAADNMSIPPTNRFIFDFNYFHNVKFTQATSKTPIQINRFTIGFEKTFLNDLASIELRIPLAVTVNNQLSIFGENDIDKFRLGDMTLITKYVLFERRNIMWTTGIGISLPLAEDMSIVDFASKQDIIRWKNRTVHFMPYLGLSIIPDDRLFFNAILQGDNAAIGDSTYITDFSQPATNRMISVGKVYDRAYLYTSLAIGYWLRRQEIWNNNTRQNYSYNGQAPNPNPYLTPIIKTQPPQQSSWAMNITAELHWTQSIKNMRGIYHRQGNYLFDVGNDTSSFHAVDMTFGTRLLFNKKTSLGVGYAVPLSGKNRQFDGALRATYNRYF